jgi:predicted flap endonuclease-1-like 5' DNA nuclease
MYLLAAAVVGACIGWLIRSIICRRRLDLTNDGWQDKVDDLTRQRDRLTVETKSLRTTIESQQGVMHRHERATSKARTDLESVLEKAKLLSRDLFTLRSERENTKSQLSSIQNHLDLVTQQAEELQAEFVKSGDVYKSELKKSFEIRQLLQAKLDKAKLEQESFANLLQASRSERGSVNKILASAQSQLENLDAVDRRSIELEAENAQLSHDATRARQEIEALRREVTELGELRLQNKELAQCLTSMEDSRKQYQNDASRYREEADDAEQNSETLRIRLDEVEKNFANIERQQRKALSDVRKEAASQELRGQATGPNEVDDLQEIVGIGKVFEHALHELGIFSYRQIAAFGISDIARVNARLKEFRGRMEQDDWIGQAKELQFNKYGRQSKH